MRTTLDIDDELLRTARRRAAEQGTTLTRIVEEALAAALTERPRQQKAFRLRWKPHRGRYLGQVDIADRDALYDRMEERR